MKALQKDFFYEKVPDSIIFKENDPDRMIFLKEKEPDSKIFKKTMTVAGLVAPSVMSATDRVGMYCTYCTSLVCCRSSSETVDTATNLISDTRHNVQNVISENT